MYRNPEHYPDPTAGAALCQLRRKENRLNTGNSLKRTGRSPCRRMPGAIG